MQPALGRQQLFVSQHQVDLECLQQAAGLTSDDHCISSALAVGQRMQRLLDAVL